METLVEIGLRNAVMAVPLGLVAFAAGRWIKRPALTHALWLLVLARLLLPPLWHVTVSRPMAAIAANSNPDQSVAHQDFRLESSFVADAKTPSDSDPTPTAATGADDAGERAVAEVAATPVVPPEMVAPQSWPSWRLAARGIWLGGAALFLTISLARLTRFQFALRRAILASPSVQYQAERMARRLGLSHSPRVWMVQGCVSPLLWGIVGQPRLILPASLWSALDDERRDALLAHELAHFCPRRPLGPRIGNDRGNAVLVASVGLGGSRATARGRGTMLRRMGGVGASGRPPGVRNCSCRYGRFLIRRPIRLAGSGQRDRSSETFERTIDHDYAWKYAASPAAGGPDGTDGDRLGRSAPWALHAIRANSPKRLRS